MSDDIKVEVIKKTQDALGKYIKKPPLTDKLLKKPPFRFLHDIITNVIRETGFLEGVFSPEELNNENVKDRDSKIAFLQKAIDAVKSITGMQIAARPSKIVAGHEPAKTNEFLQTIGKALEKKLDSSDYAAKPKQEKTGKIKSTSKEEASKPKSKSSSQIKLHSKDKSKTKDTTKKKGASHDKTSKTPRETETKETKELTEAEVPTVGEPAKEDQFTKSEEDHKIISSPHPPVSNHTDEERNALKSNPSSPKVMQSPAEPLDKRQHKQETQDEVKIDTANSVPSEKIVSHERKKKSAKINNAQAEISKEVIAPDAERKEAGTPIEIGVFGSKTVSSDIIPETPVGPRITSARPRTARPASARPAAPRIRDRGEVVIQEEPRLAVGKVNVITDIDSVKEQDEFENFVVEETPLLASLERKSSASSVRPSSGDQGQHGHLVAQILETQKELEDDSQFSLGDHQTKRVEIEWEGGQRREKEIANKEVDRLRSSIQTLTRAANPLGKLMDFLQEDVDAMQRELELWRTTNEQLQVELIEEQRLTEESVEPMKIHLQQLQQGIIAKLDEISALKANVLRNDIKIKKLVTGGHLQKSDVFA